MTSSPPLPYRPISSVEAGRTPLAIDWVGDVATGSLRMLDQTKLPTEILFIDCQDVETVWEGIKMLRVRGAPAIGIAAAMGVALAGKIHQGTDATDLISKARKASDYLRTSRPTAVNLFWALDRMNRLIDRLQSESVTKIREELLREARLIQSEDRDMCIAIGLAGTPRMPKQGGVLTHCNAGALATADFGTALSVIFHAHAAGHQIKAYVDETRPLLQGSRLTAWELMQRGVPTTLLCDNMAASLMRTGKVHAVVVGADRIAANGDTANKIGTYGVAVIARAHGVPFYVAAPSSTFDFSIADGSQIPIEIRDAKEITHGMGKQTAPEGVDVYNPAFDVTPAEYITAFFTEAGEIAPPYLENLAARLRK
ncbi:S-methyl-5-thioribose-1-phosphate isomerase [bacterium]|nr:S-methyl-5-thioribose-1-phosphate isomerase [bacterium]